MTKVRLTDVSLRQLQVADGQERYFDETTPGFGVTVGKRSKTFFVVRGPTRQLTTIGRYPEISLADARKEAKRLLVQEVSKKGTMRLLDAVEAYLEDCQPRVRPGTLAEYTRPLRKAPDILLADLTKTHIESSDPHTVMAWRVFCNWCIRNELLERNPFQHIKVVYGQRERVLTDDEIRTIWRYDHPPYSHILKLCLLTGQRVGEVTQFNPTWINGDTVTIPASVAKNGNEHTIPFNLLTAQYLGDYQHQTFNGFSKGKARFDRLRPLPKWVVHDLRRTYATRMIQLGVAVPTVEALLNHVSGTISGVSKIYIRHNFMIEMRKATLLYERHIASIVNA